MATYTTTMYVCDNPGCERPVPASDDGEADGFHGTVRQANDPTSSVDWYAHTERCIGPAARSAALDAEKAAPAPSIPTTDKPASKGKSGIVTNDDEDEVIPDAAHVTNDGERTLCGLDMSEWTGPALPSAKRCQDCIEADA